MAQRNACRSRPASSRAAEADNGYREYLPGADLNAFVECYWTRTQSRGEPDTERVLPDGCIDILFHFSGTGGLAETVKATVVGTMTRALLVDPSSRPQFYLGIRFRPAGASAFLSVDCSELTDRILPLSEFWGREACLLEEQLGEVINQGNRPFCPAPGDWKGDASLQGGRTLLSGCPQLPFDRGVQSLSRLCQERLGSGLISRPGLAWQADVIRQVAREMQRCKGGLPVAELSRLSGYSRQHLSRLFRRFVGVSPKQLSRVLRFREALSGMMEGAAPDWCQLALSAGYFDQSHFINDFREFAGMSPERYLRRRHGRDGQPTGSVRESSGTPPEAAVSRTRF